MPIQLIDKIKQKNGGTFKLVDASDINWDVKLKASELGDVYSKTETDTAIKSAVSGAGHLKRSVISAGGSLPTTGDANTIYMLPNGSSGTDAYDEYMWIGSSWEKIGNSKVDLTNYVTKDSLSSTNSTLKTEVKSYADTAAANALSSAKSDAATKADNALKDAKAYTDQEKAKYLPLSGGTLTGTLTLAANPTQSKQAATKEYVDSVAAGITPENMLTPSDITIGTVNGSIKIKDKNIGVFGLKSAAYHSEDDFLSSDELVWNSIS